MKEKLLSVIFILIIGIHFLLGIIIPDREISFSERRKLAQRPDINISDIVSGSYMDRLNDYLLDQIVFRDNYMDIYGWFSRNIYRENVVNDIYIFDDYMYKIDGNTRYDSVDNIINKINDMSSYFDTDRIYYSIIPDKNYYFDLEWIPKVDYNHIVDTFNNKIKYKYIDIFNVLSLDSYYRTDIHFRQDKILEVRNKLLYSMNVDISDDNFVNYSYDYFYGSLYSNGFIKPDRINYYSNDIIDNALVYDYENDKYILVYDRDNLKKIDSYDIFLGGAKALLVINNKYNDSGRELVIFRDSFGSSLVPLMISNYSKITMVDLRYINSKYLIDNNLIDFNNSNMDVLYLYSIPIINNSYTIK